MAEFLFYGLDENGEPAFSEALTGMEREQIQVLARERLRDWHGVEIWEGPMCLVRLHRVMPSRASARRA